MFVLLAIALAYLCQWLDRKYLGRVFENYDFLEIASVADARTLVGTIATSMLAIAGVSFSSIMVTMTLASQQFGPRILRNFLKDSTSQTTLGILIATFVYCLLILRGTRSHDGAHFIPQFSTLMAIALALASLGIFIHFINHILNEIQAESVIADAFDGLESSIVAVFPDEESPGNEQAEIADTPSRWQVIANKTGYLQAIDHPALLQVAAKYDAILTTDCLPGTFISDLQPIVGILRGPALEEVEPEFLAKVQKAFIVGKVRTPEQDFQHGIRQLVEVALRALSPGVNDPFTAMDCLDYLGASLQLAFARQLPQSAFRDCEGNLRLLMRPVSCASLVSSSFNQIRQASVSKCDVSCRLLEVLESTAGVSNKKEQQEALLQQAKLINENTLPAMLNEFDRQAITTRFQAVLRGCHLTTPFDPSCPNLS